jgi:Ca2+-binding RTX toxin-like protein
VRRGLPARCLASLVVGVVASLWLPPPTGAGTESAASLLPPVPRSFETYGAADPVAVPVIQSLVNEVLDNVATGPRQQLMDAEVRIHVISRDRNITDLPPWESLRRRPVPDSDPGDSYGEARSYDDVRAVGPATCGAGPLDVAVGEEQVATFTDGTHRSPAPERLGRDLVHEMGHAVECGFTDAQRAKLDAAYAAARRRPLDDVVGDYPAYTVSNRREYFAEGTAAWFGTRDTGRYRRAWLAEHDPGLHELLADVYAVPPAVPTCDGQRATLVVTTAAAPFTGTPGPDVIVGSDGRDVVNGGGGADVICGRGDDDVLYGGYGPDRLLGDTGDDFLAGGADGDRIVDTDGEDRLVGGAGDDELDAHDTGDVPLPDSLDGTEASDRCTRDPNDKADGCPAP